MGFPTFSIEDVKKEFNTMSLPYIRNELNTLSKNKVIAAVYRGFYVVVPVHYVSRGVVPPLYYIDQLMAYLDKPYYVSLLSAAELLGAAHQRPQHFSVTTVFPLSSTSATKNTMLSWIGRRVIDDDLLMTKNTETGIVKFSTAELTAVDLVQYSRNIGGLSRAATVLQELCEVMNMERFTERLVSYTTATTLQRLGYIMEQVLLEQEKADAIWDCWKRFEKNSNYIPLSIENAPQETIVAKDKKWKILINSEINIDDI